MFLGTRSRSTGLCIGLPQTVAPAFDFDNFGLLQPHFEAWAAVQGRDCRGLPPGHEPRVATRSGGGLWRQEHVSERPTDAIQSEFGTAELVISDWHYSNVPGGPESMFNFVHAEPYLIVDAGRSEMNRCAAGNDADRLRLIGFRQ